MRERNAPRHRILCGLLAAAALAHAPAPLRAALPAGFVDELVATVQVPTAFAFLPDGRLLITQQTGIVRVVKDGVLLPTPALSLGGKICSNRERGLAGIAIDPQFSSNRFVYLYYTRKKGSGCPVLQTTNPNAPVNRLSRFVLPAGSDQLLASSETVLLDNIPQPGGFHLAGDLYFGPDGYLYVTVGDGGCDYAGDSGCQGLNDAARDSHVLLGKVLRITRDGGVPADNPYLGPNSARCHTTGRTGKGKQCQETYASGLRNPFRFAFDPNSATTRFYINDVGGNDFEEINEGLMGADYGWNCREATRVNNDRGPCDPLPTGLQPPLFAYAHKVTIPWSSGAGWPNGVPPKNCHAVTGGAFVPNGLWPGFDGAYLWSDYVCGGIFVLRAGASGPVAADFATALGESSAVMLRFGPAASTQALYYTTYTGGGQVRRIRHTGGAGNHAPIAALDAAPRFGALPLTVTFDGSASSDPDAGDTLTYLWSFGDGTPQQSGSQPMVQHTYTTGGTYDATLRVRDQQQATSLPATLQIGAGSTPPVPEILSPAPSDRFAVGEVVHLRGRATDAEEGALPTSALSWTVLLHHNDDHTHPYLGPETGDDVLLTGPAPEDLAATPASRLEVRLTATDASGLSTTVSQFFEPRRVQIALGSTPAGLTLRIGDLELTTPTSVTSWEGYQVAVEAPSPQIAGGTAYLFGSWSDGGARLHTYATPPAAGVLNATFSAPPDAALSLHGGRFRVAVMWEVGGGDQGAGHAAPVSDDAGVFWFFAPANLELLVKVLDACALNDRYWVFAAAVTDVQTTLVVTDTATATTRVYRHSGAGAFAPVQDTDAFATCP